MTSTSSNRTHPTLILGVRSLAGLAYAMLSSSVVPALPTIQHALHTNETGITWLLTAYLLAASVGTAILGRLGDVYGKEKLLLITLLILAAGTLLAAVSFLMATGFLVVCLVAGLLVPKEGTRSRRRSQAGRAAGRARSSRGRVVRAAETMDPR